MSAARPPEGARAAVRSTQARQVGAARPPAPPNAPAAGPTGELLAELRLAEDAAVPEYDGRGPDEPVLWFRQTIRNACGLMGLLRGLGLRR